MSPVNLDSPLNSLFWTPSFISLLGAIIQLLEGGILSWPSSFFPWTCFHVHAMFFCCFWSCIPLRCQRDALISSVLIELKPHCVPTGCPFPPFCVMVDHLTTMAEPLKTRDNDDLDCIQFTFTLWNYQTSKQDGKEIYTRYDYKWWSSPLLPKFLVEMQENQWYICPMQKVKIYKVRGVKYLEPVAFYMILAWKSIYISTQGSNYYY